MKIIKFSAENVKRLRAVEITPAGALVQVTGKNGQGKTSVLDSIWWALAGKDGIQSVPIRKGAEKARIELDLGDYIVERRFTPSGSSIHVKNRDGATYGSPQTMLDGLIGELSFDPLAFSRMDRRQQFNELRGIAKLEIDVEEIERLNKADYATRTEVNRQAKSARAKVADVVIPEAKGNPVDESGILNQIQSAAQRNAEIEIRRSKLAQSERAVRDLRDTAAKLTSDATKLRAQADDIDARARFASDKADNIEAALDKGPFPEPLDISELRVALESAKDVNAAIWQRQRQTERLKLLQSEAEALETRSRELTDRIAGREKSKLDAIAAARMPVDGLSFGDGEVTYNGLPFDQASDSEKLRISLSIAMASNPKLRVIRIRDGSLLDEDGLKAIADIAGEKDYQVWIERVDGSGKIGIVMEDGAVAADHQLEIAQ